MWILENDGNDEGKGNIFKGKKLWLRPGKKFILGRNAPSDEEGFAIDDKTVSRKHLVVEIAATEASDCPDARSRSRITLTDQNTKIGTVVNGDKIQGSYVLDLEQNIVTLGRFPFPFRFTWVPVTFTFSITTKEAKANPYPKLYETFGPLDIKILTEYQRGLTTHVVAKKRNTSRGLQALLDGKYIVQNDSFLKAVIAAVKPDNDGSSPLEKDFGDFPDPMDFLPPGANENETQRGDTAFLPNPSRQDMFAGYTFIFYDLRQYENLLAPITDGAGKALYREVLPNQTEVEDFVRYVKSVAGEKGLGEFEDGSEGKGVVVVRFNPVKGVGADWFAEFNTQVSLYLDHRLIEQNEFLDAILGNDASVLRRPLEVEASGVVAPPPSAATGGNQTQTLRESQPIPNPTPAESEPAPEPPRRGRVRRTAAPRFKGFDDDDDPPVVMASIPESMPIDSVPAVEPESQGLFVTQDPEYDIYRAPSEAPETQTQTRVSRKRKATPLPEDDEEDAMETMAPAAARLKKRRVVEEAARRQRGESTPPPPEPPKPKEAIPPKPEPKRKKKEKEVDAIEEAHIKREKAEALAQEEIEPVVIDGLNYQDLQALSITEEMEVKPRKAVARPDRADESERWDDKWNGRKNFKKFRRRGAAQVNARDLNRVIVPLEEAPTKSAGVGPIYWPEESVKESQRGKKKSQFESQTQSQSRRNKAHEPIASELESDGGTLPAEEPPMVIATSDSEQEEAPVKRGGRSQKLKDKTSERANAAPKKRAAATTLMKPAPAKRAKQTKITQQEESEDSEDEYKFKMKKRS